MTVPSFQHQAQTVHAVIEARLHAQPYPPLEAITRPTVPTDQASYYLNRRPQTMRTWAIGRVPCPISPLRINGRLAWSVPDIRRLLGVSQ